MPKTSLSMTLNLTPSFQTWVYAMSRISLVLYQKRDEYFDRAGILR
jgi:hypothetical protein